jgi:hypothetical protein
MVYMQLPSLFSRKTATDKYFLSLFIADDLAQAGLWTVRHNQVEFLEHSAVHSYASDTDAEQQVDAACQELGPDADQATKVVFGFDPSWIEKTAVKSQKKAFLKQLSTKLNLEPVGFVSVTESLIQQLITQDALISGVVLFSYGQTLYGFLCKQGKLLAQVEIGKSEDSVADSKEVVARLTQQTEAADHYLPPRILLAAIGVDEAEIAAQQQQISRYAWVPEFSFVQSPAVEILPSHFIIEAVTKQGGLAVAKAQGLVTAIAPTVARSLDADMAETDLQQNAPGQAPAEADTSNTMATTFGIPMAVGEVPVVPEARGATDDDFQAETAVVTPPDSIVAFPHSKHPLAIKKTVLVGAVIGLLTTLVVGWLVLWFMFGVQVTVQLATGTVNKDVKITLDPKAAASNPENLILKAELVKKEMSGADTVTTTGIKLVGEKAKGKIVLVNKTNSPKLFTQGTSLTSGTIKFVLDADTQIASATATSTALEFSQTEANVTAVDIGAEANLAKETTLKIADFDANTYSAFVKEGLTGGASREVRVVAQEDRQKLQKTLTDDLTKKAADEFKTDSTNGTFIVPTGKITKLAPTFDAELGKEAETLGLELTAEFEGLSYTREDLQPLVAKIMENELPSGYILAKTDPQILSAPDTSGTSSSSAKVILAANVTAVTEPVINEADLKQKLLSLPVTKAQSLLADQATLKQSEISFKPGIARWLVGRLPTKLEKIQLEIKRPE